jgi:hypothetical protein
MRSTLAIGIVKRANKRANFNHVQKKRARYYTDLVKLTFTKQSLTNGHLRLWKTCGKLKLCFHVAENIPAGA